MANQNGAQRVEIDKSEPGAELSKEAKKRLDDAAQSKAAAQEATSDTGYKVAPGKSLVTRRGVIDAGCAIGPLDCAPSRDKPELGATRLDELMKRGYVVKTK